MVSQTPENLSSTPMTGAKGAAFKRYKRLENDRTSWRSHWMEITDNLLPRRGRYLTESQTSKGRKRSSKIVDNTGGHALRTLSAGMMSGLTSPARPWFRLIVKDDIVMEQSGVKQWLGNAEKVIRGLLASSNFYTSMAVVYTELGAFGTSPLLRRTHPTRTLHYRNYTAGEYVIAEDQYGDVDTLGRQFTLPVSSVVEQFVWNASEQKMDWSKASKALKTLWEKGAYDTQVPVMHMISPRRQEKRDLTRLDGANRPWGDVYFEEGADNDTLLQDSGYNRKPFFVSRWDVTAGDVYGISPAMETLGDIKQLQHEQKRKAQAIDKMVNPPMVASLNMKGRPTTTLPAGVTYVDNLGQNGNGFAPAYLVTPKINELQQDIAEVQQRIQRGFYADLFAMMINSDRRTITATEVAERHEEKLVLLGPVLQRLNTEKLDPLIEDAFVIAMEQGLLGDAPEALQNAEIDIKYVSLMAQAQEAVAASSIERSFALAGNLVGVFPDVIDNLDSDAAYRDYVETVGNAPSTLRDMDAVIEIRTKRQEAEAAAAQAEQAQVAAGAAQQGAQAAKLLSETDNASPNALTSLIGQGTA